MTLHPAGISMAAFFSGALLALLGVIACALARSAAGEPWNLPDYRICRGLKLQSIHREVSDVTYSPVTNSVWVITRSPMVLGEYSMEGEYIRSIDTSDAKLRDPEGITWMYDYVFAVSQERSLGSKLKSSISIMDASPWRKSVELIKTIVIEFPQEDNWGLESVAWDPDERVLYAGQEGHPMAIWRVDPETESVTKAFRNIHPTPGQLRDISGAYKRAGDPGLYIMSEPSERVLRVDASGEVIRGQELSVRGSLPEGVTFTPDGRYMVIAGEPNEMFFYGADGDCSTYHPSSGSAASSSQRSSRDAGYCGWNQCSGGGGGGGSDRNRKCSTSIDRCVKECRGSWCFDDDGGRGDDSSPAKPQSNDGVPSAVFSPAGKGGGTGQSGNINDDYDFNAAKGIGSCHWQNCGQGLIFGYKWCNESPESCDDCLGVWCVDGRIVEARATAPAPAAAQPEPPGFSAVVALDVDKAPQTFSLNNYLGLNQGLSLSIFGSSDGSVRIQTGPRLSFGRRLREDHETTNTTVRLEVTILAETAHHAAYLTEKLELAVASGTLTSALLSRMGSEAEPARIRTVSRSVRPTEVQPRDYPSSGPNPNKRDSTPVVILKLEEDRAVLNVIVIASAAALLAFAALVAACAVLRCRLTRPRISDAKTSSDVAVATNGGCQTPSAAKV